MAFGTEIPTAESHPVVENSFSAVKQLESMTEEYLTLYSVKMTYNLKKSIIQSDSVCKCICLHPWLGSLSAQCVVL